MGKKTSKRAKPTIKKPDGKRAKPTIRKSDGTIQQIDSRKLQALYIYNQLHCTQLQLSDFFNVSENTISTWLADAREVIDDGNMLEMAKARFQSMVPQALEVYSKALELGQIAPRAEFIGAAKDVLKNHRVLTEEVDVNLNVSNREDKELEDGIIKALGDRFKPIIPDQPSDN